MKVFRLIELLQQMDPQAEVRLVIQPHRPLEYTVDDAQEVEVEGEAVVYLTEGEQLGYLPSEAEEALGLG